MGCRVERPILRSRDGADIAAGQRAVHDRPNALVVALENVDAIGRAGDHHVGRTRVPLHVVAARGQQDQACSTELVMR